jgi:hypothetical protein
MVRAGSDNGVDAVSNPYRRVPTNRMLVTVVGHDATASNVHHRGIKRQLSRIRCEERRESGAYPMPRMGWWANSPEKSRARRSRCGLQAQPRSQRSRPTSTHQCLVLRRRQSGAAP